MKFRSGNGLLKSPLTEIGGKAAGLVQLKSAGFLVPEFFVVSTSTLWSYLSPDMWEDLVVAFFKREISLVEVTQKISQQIDEISWGSDFEAELVQHLKKIKAESLAVRSSVLDEDGRQFSFAGQMESFLFQEKPEDILRSIKAVWKSAFSMRSLEYRLLHQISLKDIGVAVIVQKMISAEVAGVMFTANPGTGNRFETMISSSFGVGEGVVNGTVDCDEFTVCLRSQQVKKAIFDASRPTLTDSQAMALARFGESWGRHRQEPADIEWAFCQGEIYFLQARPITSEMLRLRRDNSLKVFDNSNIQESFCGITLPLTFSFASEAYEQVYTQLMEVMGFSEREIAQHQVRHRNMLSYVNGRVYYNIQSWYDGLRFLPGFGKNKADMERMMGVEYPVDFVEDQVLTNWEKLRRVPQMFLIALRLGFKFVRIQKLVSEFDQWFSQQYQSFDRRGLYRLNSQELLDLVRATKSVFLGRWTAPIINDFYVMMNNGKVFRALKSVHLEAQQPALLFGEKLESTEPTKRILKISERIQLNVHAARILSEAQNGFEMMRVFKQECPEIYHLCTEYIQLYGDRVMGELKLESLSLHQDPEFLRQMLLNARNCKREDLEGRELSLRLAAESTVFMAIGRRFGAAGLFRFRRDLRNLRRGIVFRERLRMSRTKVFGLFREIYSELGRQWFQMGLLEQARDIFYLTEAEIEQKVESRSPHQSLTELIRLRRREFSDWEEAEPPAHFSVITPWISDLDFRRPQTKVSADWTGLGCFPGRVRGEVQIVHSAAEAVDLSGKILVALRTDPGWAPLFVNIKGLLVERGSSLSHSAVVARELGIPTIVGISDVTKKLKSGEVIEFDGSEGWIRHVTQADSRPSP